MFCIFKKVFLIAFLVSGYLFAASFDEGPEAIYQRDLALHTNLAQERALKFKDAAADSIISITSHVQIARELYQAVTEFGPENLWVVYDIDDCVTYPDHAACLPCSYAGVHKPAFDSLTELLDPIEKSIVWNLKYRMPKSLLTDPKLPEILTEIKDHGIRSMGLTASMAGGVLSPTDCQEEARCKILNDLGVVFNTPLEKIEFKQFPKFFRSFPVYYNGVGFAQTSENYGSTTKGEFFAALMDHWGEEPKIVFFIDDSKTNLNRFAQTMRERQIPCSCFHFKSERVHEPKTITHKNYCDFIDSLSVFAKFSTQLKKY